jgi:hypothetical protein
MPDRGDRTFERMPVTRETTDLVFVRLALGGAPG